MYLVACLLAFPMKNRLNGGFSWDELWQNYYMIYTIANSCENRYNKIVPKGETA